MLQSQLACLFVCEFCICVCVLRAESISVFPPVSLSLPSVLSLPSSLSVLHTVGSAFSPNSQNQTRTLWMSCVQVLEKKSFFSFRFSAVDNPKLRVAKFIPTPNFDIFVASHRQAIRTHEHRNLTLQSQLDKTFFIFVSLRKR